MQLFLNKELELLLSPRENNVPIKKLDNNHIFTYYLIFIEKNKER